MSETCILIQPKCPIPSATGWVRDPGTERALVARNPLMAAYPPQVWFHHPTGMTAITNVEKPTPEPGEFDVGPEYHLSVSKAGQRCTSADAAWVLGQFDMADAKEDNHVPSGRVRNFWRPVADRFSGFECPCQETEPAIREDKGDFIWRGTPR